MNAAQHAETVSAIIAKVAGMTSEQLDDWYEREVGYRLLADDPDTTDAEHRALVGSMMVFSAMPAGVDTPGAESAAESVRSHFAGA